MRLKFIPFFLCLLCISFTVPAQQKILTLEEAVLKQYTSLRPRGLSQLQWLPGSEHYVYANNAGDQPGFMKAHAAKAGESALFSLSALSNAMEKASLEAVPRLPYVRQFKKDAAIFYSKRKLIRYAWDTDKIEMLNMYPEEAEHLDLSKQSYHIAYTKGQNLYVARKGAKEIQVTQDTDDGIVNGQAAHRFEFGITTGTFWSNQGQKLAFYKVDERMVTSYPILNLQEKPAEADMIRYPMAGDESHHASVGIFDVQTEKLVWVQAEGDPEQYYTNIAWSPDDQTLYIAILNRDQNHLKFNAYDANTGEKRKTLFERKGEKYIQPLNPMIFLPGKPNEFLWLSERDGYRHFYHYNTDGKLLGQLTSGPWIVTSFEGFDEDGKTLFFTSTKESPTERHLYALDLKKKKITKLTKGAGNHTAKVHESGDFVLDTYTTAEPGEGANLAHLVFDRKGQQVKNIHSPTNPLNEYKLGTLKLFTIKANDGTPLHCRMFLPPDLDEDKKYPAIVYVYNGPGVQLIRNTIQAASPLWMQYAATQGYVVFSVDGRGSANRGRDFEQAIFRQLGKVEVDDQLAGVEYLRSLGFVDMERMGVFGWSYGGFMTTSLMLKAPGTFKVGVAGGPVIDWRMYEVMYTERYMDTPQNNPDGYQEANLMNYVDQLKGKLMLIHGTSDDVVLWQHSLNFLQKCVLAGKQVDYFVYPGHPHNVRGRDRLHLIQKVLDYLMTNLEE